MDPRHTTFTELENLVNPSYVATRKIDCIKTLRGITGEGLRETKDFFEQVWQPLIAGMKTISGEVGAPENERDDLLEPDTLPPPMFLVGQAYAQLNKQIVLVLGVSNANTSYETVYTLESDGTVVHRYNRRDFGRVTGTDHDNPDPRNFKVLS